MRKLNLIALCLTFCVVVLGAYVRLSDAGLGCPDWPLCYGKITPLHAHQEIAAAVEANPGGVVSMPKAWKEMIHRYLASTVGCLILALAFFAWRKRFKVGGAWPWLPTALVGVVIVQGLLGKWTVTLLLKPAIVSLHLLGGLSLLGLLAWSYWASRREPTVRRHDGPAAVARLARIGLIVLCAQIVLGGWVSTNYAALICHDLPKCQGSWLPPMDFSQGFHVLRNLGEGPDGDALSFPALTAIHWMHRLGALVTTSVLLVLSWRLYQARLRGLALAVLAALVLQVSLGVVNILLRLPLPIAVAHNAGAALLLLVMLRVVFRVRIPMLEERESSPALMRA